MCGGGLDFGYCVKLDPGKNIAIFAATNIAGSDAEQGSDEAFTAMIYNWPPNKCHPMRWASGGLNVIGELMRSSFEQARKGRGPKMLCRMPLFPASLRHKTNWIAL